MREVTVLLRPIDRFMLRLESLEGVVRMVLDHIFVDRTTFRTPFWAGLYVHVRHLALSLCRFRRWETSTKPRALARRQMVVFGIRALDYRAPLVARCVIWHTLPFLLVPPGRTKTTAPASSARLTQDNLWISSARLF
jgi:hypothetical protein